VRRPTQPPKPPYRVPSMAEIAAIPGNGFTVASTFSGCGGSSLGYRLAGFRVIYANEFVEAARQSYQANAASYTVLDGRDIREIEPADILAKAGLAVGALDLLDGSPPCSSFSTAGKRQAYWGASKVYSDTVQRSDDLFFEFARILDGLQPRVFVAENVSGLIKGAAKGYFLDILAALKAAGPGYRVETRLLDAQWLGVPQARQRLLFVGVRNDLGLAPAFPKPLPYRYAIRDVLPGLRVSTAKGGRSSGEPAPTVMSHGRRKTQSEMTAIIEPETDISRFAVGAEWDKLNPGGQSERYFQLVRPQADAPSPTITASGGTSSLAGVTHPTERRKFSIAELKRICGFPDDFELTGTYAQQWERLGRAVPPVMMAHVAGAVRDGVLARI